MQLILTSTQDGANVINKTFGAEFSTDILLRSDFNIHSPVIKLKLPNSQDVFSFNYCSIPHLGRKYFIDEIISLNSSVWQLSMSCDVLETYKQDILSSNARFKRKIKTGDYIDGNLEETVNKTSTKYESDVALDNVESIILTTMGA